MVEVIGMCGRFSLVTDPNQLVLRFELDDIPFEWQIRYNIAPGQLIPAIIEDRGKRRIGHLRWGLIPTWAQDQKIGGKMINARAETLHEKPAFRRLLERKRCIIPADGFYEWKQTGRSKQPMRIMMKSGEPFSFAGLYDTWTSPDGEKVHTCIIITTSPNEVAATIHERMPVILRREDEQIWLNRELYDLKLLQSLMTPYEAEQMKAYAVPASVGSPKNDGPECIQAITDPV